MPSLLNPGWYLIAGGIVLALPGLAWLAWFAQDERDLLAWLAQALGLSIATTALVALAGFLLDWQFTNAGLLLIYAIFGFLALLAWVLRMLRRSRQHDQSTPDRRNPRSSIGWRNLILVAGFSAILAWRFYQVRELALPAWVDSLHHVLIARIILENGGLPLSLKPYLPVPFYYHFAFHVIAAVFSFWSSLPPEQAVLLLGQVLNAGVSLSIYRLGLSLWQDWRRAGLAALLVGFVFQMPAYYATWGRYTLLVGLVLLPLAMAEGLDLFHRGATRRRILWLLLLTAGLLLAHYFAALLLALFLLFLGIRAGWRDLRVGARIQDGRLLPLFGAAIGGAFLALPWILRVWDFSNQYVSLNAVLPADPVDSIYFPDYLSYLGRMAGPFRNYVLLGLGFLGLVTAAARGKAYAFMAWTATLVLMAFPWGLNLSPFRPDHAVIVMFLPAGLLAADFLFTAGERAQLGSPRLARVSLGAAAASLLVWGFRDTRAILNPATILADHADVQAMDWIEANTSPEARFFVNVAPWQYGIYRGVDGGWWIPALTGRETMLPAVMYALAEPDYHQQINAFADRAAKIRACTPEFQDLLQSAGLTHVYLVKARGILHAADLESCPYTKLVYQHEGVSIYQVIN